MRTTHGARDSVLPAVLRSGILAALIAAASAIAPSIAEEPQPQKAPPAGEKPAEAAKHFQAALDRDPHYEEVREQLRVLLQQAEDDAK